MKAERRRHRRFRVEEGAMATLSRAPTVAGRIIDISEGGLSFRYVASTRRSEESSHLNLLFGDNESRLKTIPFRSVWDAPVPDAFSLGSISIRHCGVEFDGLADSEKTDLINFINNHTAADTVDIQ